MLQRLSPIPSSQRKSVGFQSKVVHKMLQAMASGGLLRERYHIDDDSGEREEIRIGRVLVESGYKSLVESILTGEDSNTVVRQIVEEYISAGDLMFAMKLIKAHLSEVDKDSEIYIPMVKKLVSLDKSDEEICAFIEHLCEDKHMFTGEYHDPSCYLRYLVDKLFEAKKFQLVKKICEDYFPEAEKDILKLLLSFYEGSTPKKESLISAMKKFCEANVAKDEGSKAMAKYIRLFEEKGLHIELLKDLIVTVEESKKPGEHAILYEMYELRSKIRKHFMDKGDFEETARFLSVTGDDRYYGSELITAKLEYAIKAKDASLHKSMLEEYVKKKQSDIAECDKQMAEAIQKDKWMHRVDKYFAQAYMLSAQAIYELAHGESEKAQEYLLEMVKVVTLVGTPGEGTITKRNKGHLKRKKRRLKREIKLRFISLGLDDKFPKQEGWRDKIQVKPYDIYLKEKEQRKADRQKARDDENRAYNEQYAAQELEVAQKEFEELQQIYEMKGEREAVDMLCRKSGERYWGKREWGKAQMFIDFAPQTFAKVFGVLCDCSFKDTNGYHRDLSGVADFFIHFARKGLVTKSDWATVASGCRRFMFSEDARGGLPEDFIRYFIKLSLEAGYRDDAWQFFQTILETNAQNHGHLRQGVIEICYGLFLQHSQDALKSIGIDASLKGEPIDAKLSDRDKIDYWNTEAEKALLVGDELRYSTVTLELQKLLTLEENARYWLDLLSVGTIRDAHQKKDALMYLYSLPDLQESVRYRVIKTLIDQRIPGAQTLPEIKSKKTPLFMTKYFFRKLIHTQVLHKNTENYLTDECIPYLRQLLSEFQNDFNTVMESLDVYFDMSTFNSYAQGKALRRNPLTPGDWKGIMSILRVVKAFSPGVFVEVRNANYDMAVIEQIKEKIDKLKKDLFSNKNSQTEVSAELEGEIIYFAYKPANMTLGDVVRLCRQLKDCTSHLDGYVFPEQGYPLNFELKKDMILRRGIEGIETPEMLQDIGKLKKSEEKDHIQSQARKLCEIGRMKITDDITLEDILSVTRDFEVILLPILKSLRHVGPNQQYTALRETQEMVGVYLSDNLASSLALYFRKHANLVSGMAESLAKSIRSAKLKSVLEQQLKIKIDETKSDIDICSFVISAVILAKYKPLQKLRKTIREDIKKFVAVDGTEVGENRLKLRAVVSKNKASFFAKASAGICTAGDIQLFQRPDHFHINIIDDTTQTCVGNVQAYIMNQGGKKYLLLRGLNPSTSLLKDIDAGSFCEAVLDIGRQFTDENNLDGMLLSEQGGFLALSNRGEVVEYLNRKYRDKLAPIEPYSITSGGVQIHSAYTIYKK